MPLELRLRVAVVLCFLGHGAWGLIGKAGWVPYYGVFGISEAWAWKTMPVVGAHDLLLGLAILWKPHRALLTWATAWCVFTACLRPLSGEPSWEVMERAGNFGPPLAMLMLLNRPRVEWVLRGALAGLLVGHGALAWPVGKDLLVKHWASVGLGASMLPLQAAVELGLASLVLFVPLRFRAVFIAALVWKVATEALFLTSGPAVNIFECIERAGDYGLPLALLALTREPRSPA